MSDLILHHYPSSPFSEKIRLILGYKKLAWKSVTVPSITPKPDVLALTAIAPFRPRRWRGAVLKSGTEVRFRVLDPHKRPVSATADSHEVRDVIEVLVRESRDRSVTLLFDPEHNLEERILIEQFTA